MVEAGSATEASKDGRDAPGKIDYTDIFEEEDPKNKDYLKEIAKNYTFHNHQLRLDVTEGRDYLLVDLPIIEFFNN